MKKLFMIMVCSGLMATVAFSQQDAPAGAVTHASAKIYHCPKCGATADKAGMCSKCKVNMVKEGDYYCPGCYTTGSKPGKCAKCSMEMKKMTAGTK